MEQQIPVFGEFLQTHQNRIHRILL